MVFKTAAPPPASTTIMVAPPVIVEPPSPLYQWLAANFKIYAPIFVLVIILGIIASKHHEDKQRTLRAYQAMGRKPGKKSNYDEALKKITCLMEQRRAGEISEEQYSAQKTEIIKSMRNQALT